MSGNPTFEFTRMTIELMSDAYRYQAPMEFNLYQEEHEIISVSAEPLIFTSLDQLGGGADHVLSISNLGIKHQPPAQSPTEDLYSDTIWTIDLRITIENELFDQTGVPESVVDIKIRFGGGINGLPVSYDPASWGG